VREERKSAVAPRSIGDLMAEVIKATAGPKRRELLELSEAWARAAGPDVARRSRPLSLGKGGQLTVSFASSALRQEVQSFRRTEILARLRTEYPARRIAAIKCVLGE
jgi:Dna[CI] antecedent DciA-like protein